MFGIERLMTVPLRRRRRPAHRRRRPRLRPRRPRARARRWRRGSRTSSSSPRGCSPPCAASSGWRRSSPTSRVAVASGQQRPGVPAARARGALRRDRRQPARHRRPTTQPAIVARSGDRARGPRATVLDEAGRDPGMRAYVVGPAAGRATRAGRPSTCRSTSAARGVGTLAALRVRGEPFARAERRSLVRLANLAALARATERYQHQRARAGAPAGAPADRGRPARRRRPDPVRRAAQPRRAPAARRARRGGGGARSAARAGCSSAGTRRSAPSSTGCRGPPAADLGTRLVSVVSGVEDEFAIAIRLRIDDERRGRRRAALAGRRATRWSRSRARRSSTPPSTPGPAASTSRSRSRGATGSCSTVATTGAGARRATAPPPRADLAAARGARPGRDAARLPARRSGTRVTAGLPLAHPRPPPPDRDWRSRQCVPAGGR